MNCGQAMKTIPVRPYRAFATSGRSRHVSESALRYLVVPNVYREAAAVLKRKPYHPFNIAVPHLIHDVGTASGVVYKHFVPAR